MTSLRNLCRSDYQTIAPEASISEAARRMSEAGEDLLLVGGPAGILGLVADEDIVLRGVARGLDPRTARVEEVMRVGLPECACNLTVEHVAHLMARKHIRQVAIVDGGRFLGIVRVEDVLHCF